MRFLLFTLGGIFLSLASSAQTGPGGVGNNTGTSTLRHWYRADANITATSGAISQWGDASGYNNHLVQATPGNSPTTGINASLNGQPVVRYGGSQFFTSSANGPGTNNATILLVARGTAYQSLIRFQGVAGTYVVYPWEYNGAPRTFIASNEGGTAGGIASGLLSNANNIGVARYRINTTNGMQTFLNGTISAQKNSGTTALPSQPLWSGRYSGGGEFPNADVGEMIVYYDALNDAQLVIVQNYLAAKFNATLTATDVYTMDNTANGDFDYDVAGIGRVNSTNLHNDAQGTGFVRILNPSDLNDNEYFMWGHNNLTAVASNTSDIPAGIIGRFNRVWRVSEATGDVGTIDVQIDVTGLADFTSLSVCDAASSIRLLIDTDNDGVFADQTPISGATNIGGNVYRFANVSSLGDANRFTFAISTAAAKGGPGGVGATNGTGNLALWLDAGVGTTTTGSAVTSWFDQSGRSINATQSTASMTPTLVANALNGKPVLNFAGDDFLALSTNINTTTPSMFIVANKTATGSGYMTFLTLEQNLWLARAPSGDQWGMHLTTDALVTQLNTTYRVMGTIQRNFNDIDFYDAGVGVTRTNGTSFHGKPLGTIGSNSNAGAPLQQFIGNIAEIVVFNTNVNSAQRIIITNYLAAKYGLALAAATDIYTRDDVANGNFDHEVAGIGRVNSTNLHSDARGTGVVRIFNPSSLGDGDYLMWGHNNLALTTNTSDVPAGIQGRWNRVWALSERNDVGTIDIQFDLTGQGPVTASDLRLLIDADGDGTFNEGGTLSVSGASALSCNMYQFTAVSGITDGMRFTLGTVNTTQTPLPIELTSFEGNIVNGSTELTWETASEYRNDHFTVERSTNGESFTALFDVPGAGTSTTPKFYAATDKTPPHGDIYYRLRQTDLGGAIFYSNIIKVQNETAASEIIVSPNPAKVHENFSVEISNLAGDAPVEIRLFDVLGRVFVPKFERSGTTLSVSTSDVGSPGIYLLKVTTPAGAHTERLLIHL